MARNLFLRSALLVTVGALALTACGDDDGTDDANGAASNGAVTTEADAPEATEAPDETDTGGDSPGAEARAAVASFMEARVSGDGADAWLTDTAREVYPDEIELYDVAAFQLAEVYGADANSFEVSVEVTTDDGGERTETLFVGPAEVDGEQVPFAIRGGVAG